MKVRVNTFKNESIKFKEKIKFKFVDNSTEYSSESEDENSDVFKNLKETFSNSYCRRMFLDQFTSFFKINNYMYLYEEKFNTTVSLFIDIIERKFLICY